MRKPIIPAAIAVMLTLAGPLRAEDPLVVPVQRLSLAAASAVAEGAVAECRARGIQVAATVVDRDGVVLVTLRDTIAAPITVPISRMKAATAANFNAPTADLTALADTAIGRVDGLLMAAGGVPIHAAGSTLVGAVGVSGAPGGEIDAACARAGLAAIAEDLDML
ncbi:GlcG/HbpS family heme-binding protein [Marichromatium bheemlicum]|uniref:Heme-binding protein n=1 Tax=Marichromatium bheemlicum TaxID=365339 RepID=A0ABX1I4Z2_9GAMM|nr:heme-binding protein [Marichromatium bheemlicum]NKN31721.1 heme-binding protein [Marichromatium bheemlicum]